MSGGLGQEWPTLNISEKSEGEEEKFYQFILRFSLSLIKYNVYISITL